MTQALSREEGRALLIAPKQSKYKSKPVWLDGRRFASKHERDVYARLKLRAEIGDISDLKLQFRYPLKVEGVVIGHYVADFVFWDHTKKCLRVLDAKGFKTELYKWKKRHMKAAYGLDIEEV